MTQEKKPGYFSYALGNGGIAILRQIAVFFTLYFYAPPAGKGEVYLSALYVGYALTIARFMDVVSDPIVGALSDRTQHKWGKRLPWIVYGTPFWILFTVAIFTPPSSVDGMLNFYYLSAIATLYFVSMTVVQVPYMAVLPEITKTKDEALNLSSSMGRWYLFGLLLVLSLGWPMGAKLGFLNTAIIFSILSGVLLLFSIRGLWMIPQKIEKPFSKNKQAGFFSLFKMPPFIYYMVGHSLFVMGYYIIIVSCPYFVTEIIGFPKWGVGIFLFLALGSAMLFSPLVKRYALKEGKKKTMLWAMFIFIGIFCSWTWISMMDQTDAQTLSDWGLKFSGAENISISVLVMSLSLFIIIGLPVAVQMLIPNAIIADLVKFDEKVNHQRRDALVFGMQGCIEKNAVMLSSLLVGFCMSLGNTSKEPWGIILIGPIAAICSLFGLVFFSYYSLGGDKKITEGGES